MLALWRTMMAASLVSLAAGHPDLVGTEAPDFTLTTLDGKEVSLKAQRGHIVVLHFWATYWESCAAGMGNLDKLYREFKLKGVAFYGVNVGQLPRVVRDFVKTRGFAYPQLINARGELILKFEATDAPTVVIIGRDGKINSYMQDELREENLRSALKATME